MRPFLTRSVAVWLVALVVVNVWAAILPWRAYGQMKQGLTARFQPEVQAGDLFVSSESGIDTIFRGNPRHVGVKEVLKQKGRVEGFPIVDALIRDQLGRGGASFSTTSRPTRSRCEESTWWSRAAAPIPSPRTTWSASCRA